MQEVQVITSMADMISGQNKAQRGQFVKGNRTGAQYEDIMANADSKPKVDAIVLEDQFFTPFKKIIGINILQFQGADNLYHEEKDTLVTIDPLLLRNAIWKFKITDGVSPVDAELHTDVLTMFLQQFASSPQISNEYRIGDIISYLMKTKGADIKQFQKSPEQVQYEQATSQWQQAVLQLAKQNPDIKQEQYPPQPVPAQYGLGQDGKPLPNSPSQQDAKAESQESLVQKIMEASGNKQEQQPEASEGMS
jgi:hypothetical protein